jgi:hypothetical protein
VEIPVRETLAERTVGVSLSDHNSDLFQRHTERCKGVKLALFAEDKIVRREAQRISGVFGWGQSRVRMEAVDSIVSELGEVCA